MANRNISNDSAMPLPLHKRDFNLRCRLPYGLEIAHVESAMREFLEFLGLINGSLSAKKMEPLESFLMPANFSSIVGEFMAAAIPRHCLALAKKQRL
jgi:hypothetical protein